MMRENENGGGNPPFFREKREVPPLDARLALAASLVRDGQAVCDVGTDHGYLPIYLLCRGIVPRAIACDINAAPLNSARRNATRYGCTSRMAFYLADGLTDVPLRENGVGDILLCGMGGELIARILTSCDYTKEAGVRAILQPMSSAEDLRRSLAADGYRIDEERLTVAAGRVYTCIAVSWDGTVRVLTPAEALLGPCNIRVGRAAGEAFTLLLRRAYEAAQKKYRGRAAGSLDTRAESALLTELLAIAEKEGISLDDLRVDADA